MEEVEPIPSVVPLRSGERNGKKRRAAPAKEREPRARGLATREAIIDAALELFGMFSYDAVTIAAVARRINVTDAGVLYHFKTKADLLVAVLTRANQHLIEGQQAAVAVGGRAGLELYEALGHVMEGNAHITALYVRLTAEHINPESPAHAFFAERQERLLRDFATLFRQGIEEGTIDPSIDPDAEASDLMAHLDGIRLQWFYSNGRISMGDSVQRYVRAMLDRVGVVAPAGDTPTAR